MLPAGTFSYGYLAPVVGGETHGSRRWTTLTRPGGGVIEQQYVDPLRRLTRTELRHSNGTVLNRHDYGYDLRSQRTSHTRAGTHYATSGTYARVKGVSVKGV